jgi:putative transposase
MALFGNKFRIESARLRNWDYASPGGYFITICTNDRKQYFGEIINGKMALSEKGMVADKYWREIPDHFPEIRLDQYVIMPNHIHGILDIIPGVETPDPGVSKNERYMETPMKLETPKLGVSTNTNGSMRKPTNKSLGVSTNTTMTTEKGTTIGIIINQFKRACTLTIKKRGVPFGWQSRFYDHIIRDDRELSAIRQYILYNPANWDTDRDVIETQDIKTGKQPWFVYMG